MIGSKLCINGCCTRVLFATSFDFTFVEHILQDCESNQQLRLEFTQITKTQPIHALFDITWETDVLDLVVKTIGFDGLCQALALK